MKRPSITVSARLLIGVLCCALVGGTSVAAGLPAASAYAASAALPAHSSTGPSTATSPRVSPEQDCQQVTTSDGKYEFSGCFQKYSGAGGAEYATEQLSNFDGIDISASEADNVVYDVNFNSEDMVYSTWNSTESLDLDGALIPLATGGVASQLTGPLTLPVAKGVKLAGLAVPGQLTVTPSAGGAATVTGAVTLPAVLGGGKATLSFTTTVNKGLSKIQVTVAKATFMQLFSVSNLKLSYAAGSGGTSTWTVSGTASTGGKTSAKFSGDLTYTGNTLTSASLKVGNISLAGMSSLSNLTVTYSGSSWTGSATLGQGASAVTAKIALSYGSTGLTSGSLQASNVQLFGVLTVDKFGLSYADGTWNLAVAGGTKGSGGSATLTITNGIVTAADLTITDVSFLGKFTVASAEISYAQQAPDPACSDVPGEEIWCGSWQVELPQALAVSGISGSLATDDGQFYQGSIDVKGNVPLPLFEGIFLTRLGASLTLGPPVTITGDAGLSFGPKINGKSLISVDGTLTRTLPDGDTSGSYVADGTFKVLNRIKGTVKLTVPGDDSPTSIDLTASVSVSGASATGQLDGSFTASTFTLGGDVEITVDGHTFGGTMKADDTGMAACGAYKDHEAGFALDWSTNHVTFLGTSGCKENGF